MNTGTCNIQDFTAFYSILQYFAELYNITIAQLNQYSIPTIQSLLVPRVLPLPASTANTAVEGIHITSD